MKKVDNTWFQSNKSSLPKKVKRTKPIIYHGNFFRSLFFKKSQIYTPSTQRTCVENLFLTNFLAGKSKVGLGGSSSGLASSLWIVYF